MSAAKEPPESPTAVKVRCGKWMPRANATCGRKADHPGKCVTEKALKADVDRRPPWTSRRHGVRAKTIPPSGRVGAGPISSIDLASPSKSST
jgi:hypothetical protein